MTGVKGVGPLSATLKPVATGVIAAVSNDQRDAMCDPERLSAVAARHARAVQQLAAQVQAPVAVEAVAPDRRL